MNKVYVVLGIFNTEFDSDITLEVFANRIAAENFFNNCIAAEMESDWFKELPNPTIETAENILWCAYQKDTPDNYSKYSILEERILK